MYACMYVHIVRLYVCMYVCMYVVCTNGFLYNWECVILGSIQRSWRIYTYIHTLRWSKKKLCMHSSLSIQIKCENNLTGSFEMAIYKSCEGDCNKLAPIRKRSTDSNRIWITTQPTVCRATIQQLRGSRPAEPPPSHRPLLCSRWGSPLCQHWKCHGTPVAARSELSRRLLDSQNLKLSTRIAAYIMDQPLPAAIKSTLLAWILWSVVDVNLGE